MTNTNLHTEEERIIADFRDFYWENGKYQGRKLGIDGYIAFIRSSLASYRQVMREEIKTMRYEGGDNYDMGFHNALDKVATLLQEKKENICTCYSGWNEDCPKHGAHGATLLQEKEDRCTHGVHGEDCYKCFPATNDYVCTCGEGSEASHHLPHCNKERATN